MADLKHEVENFAEIMFEGAAVYAQAGESEKVGMQLTTARTLADLANGLTVKESLLAQAGERFSAEDLEAIKEELGL